MEMLKSCNKEKKKKNALLMLQDICPLGLPILKKNRQEM